MTDFKEVANQYIDKWPEMSPSSRWLNLVQLLMAAYAEGCNEKR